MVGPILAIESSCDETAVAIIDAQGQVLANAISSQDEVHAQFGGVVPEIAAREHLTKISRLTEQALLDADMPSSALSTVAATYGPGLIGPLMIGLQFAKGFAQALDVPFIGIHHIEGHLMAAKVDPNFPPAPFLALIASGGHSALYEYQGVGMIDMVSETRDDAAGEAFDKIAKLLGLGYPGGRVIDERAELGDETKYALPISLKQKTVLDYSFSGLKTAVRLLVEKLQKEGLTEEMINDVCACSRRVIVDALLNKAFLALSGRQLATLVLGGGVAANSLLRSEAVRRGKKHHVSVYIPPKILCTDNAVMIALVARARRQLRQVSDLTLGPQPGATAMSSSEVVKDERASS
jgi:N6-L-threonylcarbamoyladenine synthase